MNKKETFQEALSDLSDSIRVLWHLQLAILVDIIKKFKS